ncbi:MAG: DUF4392 domain-containing protein [Syntrophaceae bacterium]|nr:DUF4392 domain-containing protein [Syntrophaceae bacterium]
MVLPEHIHEKIFMMEEVINFPTSLLSHPGYHWDNLPMVPYSDLAGAVLSLATRGRKVVIITGFFIPAGKPPAAETDGPPGALILAEGLKCLGMEVSLLSDEFTLPTLKAGLEILKISAKEIPLICFPIEHTDQDPLARMDPNEIESPISLRFAEDFFDGPLGKDLTHLIYIERVGPNHTLHSFLAQERQGPPPLKDFETLLPPHARNRCFSSRLEDITRFTAKTHLLIEVQKRLRLPIESIGIGDRGNEIGAGRIPWEVFRDHSTNHRETIFCSRTKTDYFISCGISNWGGYALMAAVALTAGRPEIFERITPEQERRVLDHLIHHGPAIDGMTFKQDTSVDGIGFNDYMKIIERIKEIALE